MRINKIHLIKLHLSALLIFLNGLNLGCTTSQDPLYAQGMIGNQVISEKMDSEIAKSALTSTHNNYFDPEIQNILNGLSNLENLTDADVRYLTKKGSTDFASIIFTRTMLKENNNLYWQTESRDISNRLNTIAIKSRIKDSFAKHHALLIPGWHWESRKDTGADLEFQRRVLASFGLTSTLVKTKEHGTVEANNEIITNAITKAKTTGKSIILVSVSKGGADTAYALGSRADASRDLKHVAGWLNIGGIIHGSTLVDLEFNQPERWLSSIGFSPDTPLTAVESLQKEIALQRSSELSYPEHIHIVNYVAVPFANNLTERSRYSYQRLATYGPNDGAALTQEMIVPNKHTVFEIGIDHFMRSLHIMNRAIALLYLITIEE